jgi:peroxiredoxin
MRNRESEESTPLPLAEGPGNPAKTGPMIPGAVVAQRDLVTFLGQVIALPDPERYVHLQFQRFAGCPICELHLRSFAQRRSDVVKAGIREVVVFHSPVEQLAVQVPNLPFAAIADPDKRLYSEFGVKTSLRSLLDPRAAVALVRGAWQSIREAIVAQKSAPALHITGGLFGLPADFLIASDGRIVASRHGVHAYDQWSVDELLGLVASQETRPSASNNQHETGHSKR